MATKKATTIKSKPSSGEKIAAKKITQKVTVKKTNPAKKAVTPIKKATVKKVAPKRNVVIKKATAPKKVIKKTSKAKVKPELNSKKNANELLVDAAVEGILEVKGQFISILDLREINNRVCDYYIICQADSSTQVNAIAGSVEEMVKKRIGEKPYHTEGFQNSEWILVDYVTVVVHIFQSHIREFYNLESLWADAEITRMN